MNTSTPLKRAIAVTACAVFALALVPGVAESSPASAAAKRTGVAVTRAIKARLAQVDRLDRAAHRRAVTRLLAAPRRVFRYVPSARARQEVQRGFARMTHFTTRAVRGRPLSALSAQRRYGLPQTPTRRLTVMLGKGTRIRTLKTHGGAPGVGELVNVRKIPPTHVRVTALK